MTTEKNKIEGGTLYLVATPIGNLSDLSERAVKTLSEVDYIAAEDTRNTLRLLNALGIHATCISYHEHNKRSSGQGIVERLLQGASFALVTDAGMPAISDPGEDLVRLCAEHDIPVRIVPGACAAVSALALSALTTARFVFEGFLSTEKKERNARLAKLQNEERTMILYEAPHKLRSTLKDLADTFGPARKIALCRELTKINEETMRTTLQGAIEYYAKAEPRGEYVLVLSGGAEDESFLPPMQRELEALCALSPEEHVAHYEKSGLTRMEATKAAAKDRGLSKSDFYKILHS